MRRKAHFKNNTKFVGLGDIFVSYFWIYLYNCKIGLRGLGRMHSNGFGLKIGLGNTVVLMGFIVQFLSFGVFSHAPAVALHS